MNEHKKNQALNNYIINKEDDTAFACTKSGLWHFVDAKNNPKLRYKLFPNREITHVFLDKSSNLWVSTSRNGIFVINNFNKKQINADFNSDFVKSSTCGDNY